MCTSYNIKFASLRRKLLLYTKPEIYIILGQGDSKSVKNTFKNVSVLLKLKIHKYSKIYFI